MSQYEIFAGLHRKGNPLLLGNAWNVTSATIYENNGFKAIGTSSAAIANSLGYEDGEKIPFAELFFIVEKIVKAVTIPVSVDLEAGYSRDITQVISNIDRLIDAGVVGINLEDTVQKQLVTAAEFSKKLGALKNHLLKTNKKLFINARTDAFLLGLSSPLEQTLERIRAYENEGANGIFVPFVKDPDEIKKITGATPLPLNVLSMPNLPSFETLAAAGVGRISLGSTAFRAGNRNLDVILQRIGKEKNVEALFL